MSGPAVGPVLLEVRAEAATYSSRRQSRAEPRTRNCSRKSPNSRISLSTRGGQGKGIGRRACLLARAGRRRRPIGLAARPASRAQQGRGLRALLSADLRELTARASSGRCLCTRRRRDRRFAPARSYEVRARPRCRHDRFSRWVGGRSGDHVGDDPGVTIRPAAGAGVRIGFAHEHPLVAGESARMRCNPRNHVADLVDARLEQLRVWRDATFAEGRGESTIRRQALAAIAAPAQREEARRQLGRPLAHPGSRRATGSTARQTWSRVRDSRRRRPSRPSRFPRDSLRDLRARARSSDRVRTTPPRNPPPPARTRSSQP